MTLKICSLSCERADMNMRKTRVFLDSSVIIAGLASASGGSHKVLALCELGLIDPFISAEVQNGLLAILGGSPANRYPMKEDFVTHLQEV